MRQKAKNIFVKTTATGLGVGYSPFMPGTIGTLWGIGICLLLNLWGIPIYVLGVAIFTIVAVKISDEADALFGGHDSGKIVIDEIAGYLVAMLLIPPQIEYLIIGFVAFRFFDILKPYPVGMIDKKVRGGLGVVLDDIAAGIYANITLWVIIVARGLI